MFFTINELSFVKVGSREQSIKLLLEFVYISRSLFNMGFNSLKLWSKGDFLRFELADNLLLEEWLTQKHFSDNREKVASQILKNLIAKGSVFNWNETEREQINRLPIIGCTVGNDQCISQGLKIAYLNNTIAVSLNSSSVWNTSEVEIISVCEVDNQVIEQQDLVIHASALRHLDNEFHWLMNLQKNNQLLGNWVPAQVFFPNLFFSNLIVDNDWEKFQHERINSSDGGKAIIKKYGNLVAQRNFYRLNSKLSQRNTTNKKKRIIYQAGNGKDRIYLSLDLEHGGFEVCDFKGNHLGEYFFDGTCNSPAKKNHSIIVG